MLKSVPFFSFCSTISEKSLTKNVTAKKLKGCLDLRQPLLNLAGETRFERATGGFGDRCSTVEPLPYLQRTV